MPRPQPVCLFLLGLAACSKAPPDPVLHLYQGHRPESANFKVPPLTDLLHEPDAALSVSSALEKADTRLEHLVDGRLETAWHSQEATGAWIQFVIPKGRYLDHLELTSGDMRRIAGHDYFLEGPRISRVRITKDDAPLGEFDLRPDERALQHIAIHRDGGTYRMEVLASVPGTDAGQTGIRMSDLRAVGWIEPPVFGPKKKAVDSSRRAPTLALPSLSIGTTPYDAHRAEVLGPFPSLGGIRAHTKDGEIAGCISSSMVLASGSAPLPGFLDAVVADCGRFGRHRVALRTYGGWFLVSEILDPSCAGSGEACQSEVTLKGDAFHDTFKGGVLITYRALVSLPETKKTAPARGALECTIAGRPRCGVPSIVLDDARGRSPAGDSATQPVRTSPRP